MSTQQYELFPHEQAIKPQMKILYSVEDHAIIAMK